MHLRACFVYMTVAVILIFSLQPMVLSRAQDADRCPDSLPHRLINADYGLVTGDGLRMRDNPSLQANLVTQLEENQAFSVVDGPTCADGYTWWQISYNEITGWVVQGDATEYWIDRVDTPPAKSATNPETNCPIDMIPQFGEGDHIHAVGTKRINVRDDSSLDGLVLGQVTASDMAIVVGVLPVCHDHQVWWLVELDGTAGWVLESDDQGNPLIQEHRFHDIAIIPPSLTSPINYAISDDGQRIAATRQGHSEIYIYDILDPQEPIAVMEDDIHDARYFFSLSSDGQLLTFQYNKETSLWDIEQGIKIDTQETVSVPNLMMLRMDDTMLTNGFGLSVRLLDYSDLTEIWGMAGIDEVVDSFDWHIETNQVIAIPATHPRTIYLATIGSDETTLLEPIEPAQDITCVRFHPSGTRILLAQFEGQLAEISLETDGETRIKQLGISHNPGSRTCAITADGRYFAVPYWNVVYIWDLETDQVHVLDGHSRGTQINQLRFIEDDTQLLSSTFNGELLLWDIEQVLRD